MATKWQPNGNRRLASEYWRFAGRQKRHAGRHEKQAK